MALDIGFSPRGFERFFGGANRSGPAVWGDYVLYIERVGQDWQQLQRVAVSEFWSGSSVASEKLDQIEAELNKLWDTSRTEGERVLSIPSESPHGFDVELYVDGTGIRGSFGGLAQDFDTISGAMRWVRRALSASYRLRTVIVGGIPREWRLEAAGDPAAEREFLAGGHPGLLSSFKAKTVEYRQNGLGLGQFDGLA